MSWRAIRDAMVFARAVRRLGGDSRALHGEIEELRDTCGEIPAAGALLDLVAAAARGPVVVGQLGQTLDGRIATAGGQSHYVNGPAALDHLHRLRALADAVIVGAGTLRDDDPALTVRRCDGDNPVRVILAGRQAIPDDRQVFTDTAATTLVTGIDLPVEPEADGRASPARVIAALGAIGLDVVLVEGGAATVSRFLADDCLDRLHLLVAPTILGSGRSGIELAEAAHMDEARRFNVTRYPLGADQLVDLVPV